MWQVCRVCTPGVGGQDNATAIELVAGGTWWMWSALNMEGEYSGGHRYQSLVIVEKRLRLLMVGGLRNLVQRCLLTVDCLPLSRQRGRACSKILRCNFCPSIEINCEWMRVVKALGVVCGVENIGTEV